MFLQESWIFSFDGGFSGFKLSINVSRYFGNADFPLAAQLNASVPNQHLLNKTSPFSQLISLCNWFFAVFNE